MNQYNSCHGKYYCESLTECKFDVKVRLAIAVFASSKLNYIKQAWCNK